jgi:lactoylglutathione lyase
MGSRPLIRSIDSLQVPVPDLDLALAFYRDRLGHRVIWRSDTAVGLRLPADEAELVLQIERPEQETDLMVADVDAALVDWAAAGGSIEVPAFDIQIGHCAVVRDPFGNRLVLLDASKGPLDAAT